MAQIKLESAEGQIIVVDMEFVKCSGTLQNIVEALNLAANEEEVIPLKNVSARILKKIIQWAYHHKDDIPTCEANKEDQHNHISEWDMDFFQVDEKTMFEITVIAQDLDIKGLADIANKLLSSSKGQKSELVMTVHIDTAIGGYNMDEEEEDGYEEN